MNSCCRLLRSFVRCVTELERWVVVYIDRKFKKFCLGGSHVTFRVPYVMVRTKQLHSLLQFQWCFGVLVFGESGVLYYWLQIPGYCFTIYIHILRIHTLGVTWNGVHTREGTRKLEVFLFNLAWLTPFSHYVILLFCYFVTHSKRKPHKNKSDKMGFGVENMAVGSGMRIRRQYLVKYLFVVDEFTVRYDTCLFPRQN